MAGAASGGIGLATLIELDDGKILTGNPYI